MPKLFEEILRAPSLLAQIDQFAEESLVHYIVGLPIIFAVMLLIYGIVKYVFAGSSQPDKEAARKKIWIAISIFIIVFIGFAIFNWLSGWVTIQPETPGLLE